MTLRFSHTVRVIIVMFLASASTAFCALPELVSAQEKFTAYLHALSTENTKQQQAWEGEYRAALSAYVSRTQRDGDLDGLLRAKEEVARFERIPVLTPRMTSSSRGGLRAVMDQYLVRSESLTRSHNQSIAVLFDRYTSGLAGLESRLTTEGNIAAAVEVRQARQKATENDDFRRAQFELAAASLGTPGSTDPAQLDVNPHPGNGHDDATPAPRRTDEMAPRPAKMTIHGVTVYASGSPPREAGVSFKRLTLNRTSNAPIKSSWAVSAQTAREETSKTESQYLSKVFGCRLRVSIRASLNQENLQNVLVVTQYYQKPAQGRGKVEPQLAMTRRTPLSFSAGDTVLLDYPSFDVWTARVKGGNTYGEEFYGLTISIFGADGELYYQTSSVRGLDDVGPATLPGEALGENVSLLEDSIRDATLELASAYQAQKKEYSGASERMRVRKAKWRLKMLQKRLERAEQD